MWSHICKSRVSFPRGRFPQQGFRPANRQNSDNRLPKIPQGGVEQIDMMKNKLPRITQQSKTKIDHHQVLLHHHLHPIHV